jgi:hypothetical protein
MRRCPYAGDHSLAKLLSINTSESVILNGSASSAKACDDGSRDIYCCCIVMISIS